MPTGQASLPERIEKIKQEIAALGDLRPGALSRQYNVCGNPKCRCKADPPQKHGPYYQLSFTWNGKSTSQFVRKQDVAEVKKQLKNYRRLQKLVHRWVTLAMQLSREKSERGQRSKTPKTRAKSRSAS